MSVALPQILTKGDGNIAGADFGKTAEMASNICSVVMNFFATALDFVPPSYDKLPIPKEVVKALPPPAPVAAPSALQNSKSSWYNRLGDWLFGSKPEKDISYKFLTKPDKNDLPTDKSVYLEAFTELSKGLLNYLTSQVPLKNAVGGYSIYFSCSSFHRYS